LTLVAPRYLYDGGRLLAEAEILEPRLTKVEVMLSRPDAERLGLNEGDVVTISHNGSAVDLPIHINRRFIEGVAVLPRNLAGRPAEQLVGSDGLYASVQIEKAAVAEPVVEAAV
jgi:NADH-quinone oxidoreductase subunit G